MRTDQGFQIIKIEEKAKTCCTTCSYLNHNMKFHEFCVSFFLVLWWKIFIKLALGNL